MSSELFWLDKNCPVCEQGRLFIKEDVNNESLYLHCEECEVAWLNPEEIETVGKVFLAINPDFETRTANRDTIQKHGWTKYKINTFKE